MSKLYNSLSKDFIRLEYRMQFIAENSIFVGDELFL